VEAGLAAGFRTLIQRGRRSLVEISPSGLVSRYFSRRQQLQQLLLLLLGAKTKLLSTNKQPVHGARRVDYGV